MEKAVVIGGGGFLGSHIADELTERGFHVVVLDIKESPWIRPDQEMIIGDVFDSQKLDEAMAGATYCYHFAGIADTQAVTRTTDGDIACQRPRYSCRAGSSP